MARNAEYSVPTVASRTARLRLWIVIIGILVIAAIAGSSAHDAWQAHNNAIAATNRELGNLAKVLAEQTADTLQTTDLLLRDTVSWYENERPTIEHGAQGKLAGRAAGLPQVRVVSIIDDRGVLRFRSRDTPQGTFDVSDRAYFIAHRENPNLGVLLGGPLLTRLDNRPAIVMSRRLQRRDGAFDGIAQAVIDLDEFQRVYRAIDLGEGSAIDLLRDDGTLIVRHPSPADGSVAVVRKFPELVAAASVPEKLVLSSIDQMPRLAGVVHLAGFPLVVAVTRERDVALAAWHIEANHIAVRTVALTLLGALAIVMLVRQLRRIERSEMALRLSEERYALAMEGANEGHFDWNLQQRSGFLSPRMKVLHGRPEGSSVTSRDAWMASIELHPDDVAVVDAALLAHLEGRVDHYEAQYRVRHSDGQWHWLQARGRCIRDPSGAAVVRFVGSAIDITSQRHAAAERERLEVQLRQSQKLEAIGTLAGGIAHDFNNILGAILGYGELAQKAVGETGVARTYLNNVMHAGNRAKALVERILAFSRSGVAERGPVNVEAVIDETLALVGASLSPGIRLIQRLEGGNAAVIGDATQLHQVAMNLCTNALHAMANGGVLEVRLERAQIDAVRSLSHGTLAVGAYVHLCVADTGGGISPHVLERMFDPFFTTKGVGEGTGLGLSLVHGIVADLGGAIDVQTTLGVGTRFSIWLPVAGEVVSDTKGPADNLPRGRGETVMIVDDERALVALTEENLAQLGYEPVGFDSPAAACAAFAAEPQRFDLVLTDETMPERTGTELAGALRSIRPDIPIVLMSGYSSASLQERAGGAGIREVLRKPLQARDLAECIQRVLHSPVSR
jgi:PAS domain S-box-containing protein